MAKGVTADMGGYELLVSFTFTLDEVILESTRCPRDLLTCVFGFNVMLEGSILGFFVRGLSERVTASDIMMMKRIYFPKKTKHQDGYHDDACVVKLQTNLNTHQV
jgi:hypothetical protein